MAKKQELPDTHKPTFAVQVACLFALVALVLIDAIYDNYSVPKEVYLIIAGILFGVADIRKLFGGNK